MSEYKHGEMDITTQKETFSRFISVGVWSCVVIAIALLFLAIVGV